MIFRSISFALITNIVIISTVAATSLDIPNNDAAFIQDKKALQDLILPCPTLQDVQKLDEQEVNLFVEKMNNPAYVQIISDSLNNFKHKHPSQYALVFSDILHALCTIKEGLETNISSLARDQQMDKKKSRMSWIGAGVAGLVLAVSQLVPFRDIKARYLLHTCSKYERFTIKTRIESFNKFMGIFLIASLGVSLGTACSARFGNQKTRLACNYYGFLRCLIDEIKFHLVIVPAETSS